MPSCGDHDLIQLALPYLHLFIRFANFPFALVTPSIMVYLASAIAVGLVGLAGLVSAHPGHDVKAEAAERAAFLKRAPIQSRSLAQCASKLKARGHENRSVARRQHAVKNLRASRGLESSMF